MTLKIQPL